MSDVGSAAASGLGLAALAILTVPGLVALVARVRARRPAPAVPSGAPLPRLVFLVPAHNESLLIAACVQSLLAMDYPVERRRIVVVADNCSDDTAALARRHGAECLERHDLVLRGKPRAMAWAIEQLGVAAGDAFIIIDADSVVLPDYARAVAALPGLREGAAQTYFAISNEFETWLTRLAGVLMRVRYDIQFPAKRRAGLNVPLTGNGMVLGAALLSRHPWQAFSVTEDWELYAEYTARGIRIDYAREAVLRSQEARDTGQSATQRQRWQVGRREVLRRWGPAIRSARTVSLLQKIDACVELAWPSPVLHGAATGAAAVLALAGGAPASWVALGVTASLAELGSSVVSALARHPQPAATLRALCFVPGYALWRVAVGARSRFSRAARGEWLRTARHVER